MAIRYFTVGMAGHIDHGKTALTKALSLIDTDTLKAEKERKITIEPGVAPFQLTPDIHTALVDVPGHEKFIRQMIAGVAGIDLVLIVIAADEGIMPQTREHAEILSYLQIQKAIIVFTKANSIDEEMKWLLEDEINELTKHTPFASCPHVFVDSLSLSGIEELKKQMVKELTQLHEKDASGSFRMPIDSVFSVKGQGVVVRGTVFEGRVQQGETLSIEPQGKMVKVRNIQIHKQDVSEAKAGQRAAINLSGDIPSGLKRGSVLIAPESCISNSVVDVELHIQHELATPIKQRSPVKFYTGTSEVMGRIIFFDRNQIKHSKGPIYCQIQLNESILIKREDRFIIRRPTPEETIGGGRVIDACGSTYKFGEETVYRLQQKALGSPEDQVLGLLLKHQWLPLTELSLLAGIPENAMKPILSNIDEDQIIAAENGYAPSSTIRKIETHLFKELTEFHEKEPMKPGINKAELIHSLTQCHHSKIIVYLLEKLQNQKSIINVGPHLALNSFSQHFPKKWEKRMQFVVDLLKRDGFQAQPFQTYCKNAQLPESLWQDLRYFLIRNKRAIELNEDYLIHYEIWNDSILQLQKNTKKRFTVQEAKTVLGMSRKYMIPFLEQLDDQQITVRKGEEREWK